MQDPGTKRKAAPKRKVAIDSDTDDDFVIAIDDGESDDAKDDAEFIDDEDVEEEDAPKSSKRRKTASGKAAPVKAQPAPKAKATTLKLNSPPASRPTSEAGASKWVFHTCTLPAACTCTLLGATLRLCILILPHQSWSLPSREKMARGLVLAPAGAVSSCFPYEAAIACHALL